MSRKPWSETETTLLKEAYTTRPTQEMYRAFPNRTKKSVQRKAQELGLKRPKDIFLDSKPCTKCGNLKSIDSFGLDSRTRDGHTSHCTHCTYLYLKVAREKDPSIVRAEYARRRGSRQVGKPTIDLVYGLVSGVCYLCNSHIDRTLRHPNPMSLSMDHKVPISKGGEHSMENLRATHLRCNLRKNNKVLDE